MLIVLSTDELNGLEPEVAATLVLGRDIAEGDLLVVFHAGDATPDSPSVAPPPPQTVKRAEDMGISLFDAAMLAIKKDSTLTHTAEGYVLTKTNGTGRVVRQDLADILRIL